jgi:hypothetical protein
MNKDCGYISRILNSWHIPACGVLATATHLLIERLVLAGSFRGAYIMLSFFLSPLIISTIVRVRKVLWGAIINVVYITICYSAFILERGWLAAKNDFWVFLLLLGFGLVCGACAGGFHDRLSERFSVVI